mmetsp:Transcript_16640/g.18506  ORF Transcript_16640/g.18506 Transcript_16640/m.18506 type:complete len:209 (+) Transcript_16640:46-672(+)
MSIDDESLVPLKDDAEYHDNESKDDIITWAYEKDRLWSFLDAEYGGWHSRRMLVFKLYAKWISIITVIIFVLASIFAVVMSGRYLSVVFIFLFSLATALLILLVFYTIVKIPYYLATTIPNPTITIYPDKQICFLNNTIKYDDIRVVSMDDGWCLALEIKKTQKSSKTKYIPIPIGHSEEAIDMFIEEDEETHMNPWNQDLLGSDQEL